MKMKITGQSHMSESEIRANMCAPCPVCGKMELPIRYNRTIFGNNIFYYECSDSTYVLSITDHQITKYSIKGCGATWQIKLNPNTELQNRLTLEEIDTINKISGVINKPKLEEVWAKNKEFWSQKYEVRDGVKYND